MGTHPNVILLCTLTPDDLARATYRRILQAAGSPDDDGERTRDIKINETDYHTLVMESDYDEGWQLSGKPGDILIFDLVTYGYGEAVAWDKLEQQKRELETWAQQTSLREHCQFTITVAANYW